MSLINLARGDVLGIYEESSGDWTDEEEVISAGSVEGCLQTLGVSESRKYEADGQSQFVQILFAANPAITTQHMLKHITRGGVAISPAKWYRVRATKEEGPPGQTILWIVHAELLTNTGAPTIG
jgi:hypothetical protein